jgi:metal-sulfur cluster biosynthetic enzyme
MAARQDPEIKADVIAELEDVQAPVGGRNVLDALMVEDIKVDRGLVSLVMVHPDERLAQDQEPLKNALEKALASIDGVAGVIVTHLSRTEMKARDPLAWFGDEAQDAAPKAPKKERASGGGLTLNALLKGAGCSADDVDVPLIDEDEPPSAPLSLYSGGGCAAGNTEVAVALVDQARKEAKGTPPSIAPVAPASFVAPSPVVTPASFVAPPASSAPVKPSAAQAQDAGAGNVLIDRWTYERLLAAERELSLRPSFEDHQVLLVKVAALEARLQTLREVMRGLLG